MIRPARCHSSTTTLAAILRPGSSNLRAPHQAWRRSRPPLSGYPGRAFAAQLVRSANALDPTARALLVKLEADNAKGEIFPGGYTDVHFRLPASTRYCSVPEIRESRPLGPTAVSCCTKSRSAAISARRSKRRPVLHQARKSF